MLATALISFELRQAVRLISAQWKILAQRMASPIIRQKNAAQIGMSVKNDSKQIISFALVPIGGSPNGGYRSHVRVIIIQQNLQTHTVMPCRGKQVIVHLEARLFFGAAIESTQVSQKIEFVTRSRLEELTSTDDMLTRNDDGRFA